MGRPKGSKNKEKSIEELEAMIAAKKARGTEKVLNEELKIEVPPEPETYECGNCHNSLESMLPVCPYCGTGLEWN